MTKFQERESWYRFVPHPLVRLYLNLGWRETDSLNGTHHGNWSVLMQWGGEGEPVEPVREAT